MPSSTSVTDWKVQAVERADLLGIRNLVGNGWLRLWDDADAAPNDWTYFPGPDAGLTQNTDPLYTQYGGKSLRIQMLDTAEGTVLGLRSPPFYPAAQDGLQRHCAKVRVFFQEFSGAAWFYLQLRDAIDGNIITNDDRDLEITLVSEKNPIEGGSVPTVGSWVDVTLINADLIDHNLSG